MVGVIFLLSSSLEVDKMLVDYLVSEFNFIHVALPYFSTKQLKAMAEDEKELANAKQIAMEATEATYKQFKLDWDKDYVMYPVYFKEQLDLSFNRTYYLPFKIEVPLKLRYNETSTEMSLEEYLELDEFVRCHSRR